MLIESGGKVMKKEIFKVCTLGLVSVLLFTGCEKNKKAIDTNKAEEEIVQLSENQKENKVVKVDLYSEKINDELLRLFVNATDNYGKTVWKIELGIVPYGIGLENWISYQGEDIYYLSTNSEISAYDVETGKELWTVDRNFWGFIDSVEEKENELHVNTIDKEIVINTKDGSIINE